MTTASHELALCLINENTDRFPYQRRVDAARKNRVGQLNSFCLMADHFARHYEREYGDGTELFTAEDILLAAAEVAEYYARHVAEMDAA